MHRAFPASWVVRGGQVLISDLGQKRCMQIPGWVLKEKVQSFPSLSVSGMWVGCRSPTCESPHGAVPAIETYPPSFRCWKPEIEMSVGLVPSETVLEGSVPGPSPWLVDGCLPSVAVCLSVQISLL